MDLVLAFQNVAIYNTIQSDNFYLSNYKINMPFSATALISFSRIQYSFGITSICRVCCRSGLPASQPYSSAAPAFAQREPSELEKRFGGTRKLHNFIDQGI